MNDVLIIDDEPGIRTALRSILEDERYRVLAVEDAIVGLAQLEQKSYDLVFLDIWLPRLGGMEALERIRKGWPDLEVVVISGHANVDMAVRAVKLGAFDFLEKPLSLDKVLTVTRNALAMRKLRAENADLKQVGADEELIGESEAMRNVMALIDQAAASDARILITGENGTGKELVARAVHRKSGRAGRPFVEVNCAAIPDTLIESELFGHEKGAFTDASSTRRGRFETATGGTLFLDEIGDMTLQAQSKVLRAIQEQKIERIGGEKTIEVDVRIVAATNKDLRAECAAGRFREDLFFRLNVIPISLPALRERTEDIPLLMGRFLASFGATATRLDEGAIALLKAHAWPGNVRELKNLAERISVMCDQSVADAAAIGPLLQGAETSVRSPSRSLPRPAEGAEYFSLAFNEARDLFEKNYLVHKLEENGYNVSRTAEAIGLYPSNLHAKIRKLGLRTDR
ncbi:MAG: Fis family transcriptional regulator [Treponema sp. GWB1_62_6]|nr:MAG: Fis family transcriptional regulator [Treponema sp. GWB1_62_6]OHE64096.1 MAG: Fis family transcriptional regulator [Treponema sp. GWC1_61_84]OHE67146.1 MAG: Fis family transcriptional regulator [Treponema sp. GWA1_62_8]OHE68333.1 MAG: Fis family transcriptional regulator [Treponema sp. RIFOXYC1_FULL_61_9]HCM26916.1 Fis family transcriptional regulator [Treponema sp.]